MQPRQTLLSAASKVGEASYRVLYTIGEEDVADRERQDLLLGLAKTVANSTAALVLKAKKVASECEDQFTQNRVISAATQCALATSQLVACAKVVAPTIADPQCQEQLIEAARDVAKSVEGCVSTCREVCRDDRVLGELGGAAGDVTKALNDLLNHIKDGGPDKIPDIMDQIMLASGELINSQDSSAMVRQARILAQATAELIQAIKGEAESQSDSDLQVRHASSVSWAALATRLTPLNTLCRSILPLPVVLTGKVPNPVLSRVSAIATLTAFTVGRGDSSLGPPQPMKTTTLSLLKLLIFSTENFQ